MRPDAAHRAMADRRVFEPVDDLSRLGGGIDMRHDDAERAIVQGPRGDRVFAVRHARDRRDAGIECRGRDLRAGLERHHAVLHVEKQPVEAGRRHRLGDLDAARDAHADAERQLALFELLAGDIADGGGHRRFLPAKTKLGGGATIQSICLSGARDVLGQWRRRSGEVPERSNGAVSKTVVPLAGDRGFESLPLRHFRTELRPPGVAGPGPAAPVSGRSKIALRTLIAWQALAGPMTASQGRSREPVARNAPVLTGRRWSGLLLPKPSWFSLPCATA